MKGDQVWFSEVSPRPHDTGLVTLISQDLSEFALHAARHPRPADPEHRASTGRPPPARCWSRATPADLHFDNVEAALAEPDTGLRLFGKPEVRGKRRMGVALARAATLDEARAKARRAAAAITTSP